MPCFSIVVQNALTATLVDDASPLTHAAWERSGPLLRSAEAKRAALSLALLEGLTIRPAKASLG